MEVFVKSYAEKQKPNQIKKKIKRVQQISYVYRYKTVQNSNARTIIKSIRSQTIYITIYFINGLFHPLFGVETTQIRKYVVLVSFENVRKQNYQLAIRFVLIQNRLNCTELNDRNGVRTHNATHHQNLFHYVAYFNYFWTLLK